MSTDALPAHVTKGLDDFMKEAQGAFGSDLLSAALFGTAAEGRMRPTSDVNLILVLRTFSREAAENISEPLRLARAAILLEVMFLRESEITLATESFAVKFADIESRHRVIFGKDYFAQLKIPAEALRMRLKQVLTNQLLRLRESYVLTQLREEQLSRIIADVAGPLRASAVTLLKLEGRTAPSPKEALAILVRERFRETKWEEVLAAITKARDGVPLAPGKGRDVYFLLLALVERMLGEASGVSR